MAAAVHVPTETTAVEFSEFHVEGGLNKSIEGALGHDQVAAGETLKSFPEAPVKPRASSQKVFASRPRRIGNLLPLASPRPSLTPQPPSRARSRARPQCRVRNECFIIDCDAKKCPEGEKSKSAQESVSVSEASTTASSGNSSRRPSVSSSSDWSRECDIVLERARSRLSTLADRRVRSARCPSRRCSEFGMPAWSLVFADDDSTSRAAYSASREARGDDVRTVTRELLQKKRGSAEAQQLAARLEQLELQSPGHQGGRDDRRRSWAIGCRVSRS